MVSWKASRRLRLFHVELEGFTAFQGFPWSVGRIFTVWVFSVMCWKAYQRLRFSKEIQFQSIKHEFHEKRYQTHKNEISHFAIERLSLPSNHIEASVPRDKLSTLYYFYEKNRPHSDLWDFKKCAFLLAVVFSEVSWFNATSIIWLIIKLCYMFYIVAVNV